MNWQIDWGGGAPVFGYDFAFILHTGIEDGLIELEYLQAYGHYCDACGNWRITEKTDVTEIGGEIDETRLMAYELCAECRREMFPWEYDAQV